jgi:hypothetical protein
MFIALSFVGRLPPYIIECIHQIRCFFDGDVYLITNDTESSHLHALDTIHVVDYTTVRSEEFDAVLEKTHHRFCLTPNLKGREELFIRSFERFFLLHHLMRLEDISDCLFLELDNLIYDDPRRWLAGFSSHDLCYMFDNYNRCSSGLMYVRSADSLEGLLAYALHYIQHANEFINEMSCLYQYQERHPDKVQILPTHWSDPPPAIENFGRYGDTIFDALGIGCMMLGIDAVHTGNTVVRGKKAEWCYIDYTVHPYRWTKDAEGRRVPSMWTGDRWVLINNLHVHSKLLKEGLSK